MTDTPATYATDREAIEAALTEYGCSRAADSVLSHLSRVAPSKPAAVGDGDNTTKAALLAAMKATAPLIFKERRGARPPDPNFHMGVSAHSDPTAECNLLPCPFCGSANLQPTTHDAEHYWVRCLGCQMEGTPVGSPAEAVARWNTRATPAPSGPAQAVEWSTDRVYNCKQCQTPMCLPGYCVDCQEKTGPEADGPSQAVTEEMVEAGARAAFSAGHMPGFLLSQMPVEYQAAQRAGMRAALTAALAAQPAQKAEGSAQAGTEAILRGLVMANRTADRDERAQHMAHWMEHAQRWADGHASTPSHPAPGSEGDDIDRMVAERVMGWQFPPSGAVWQPGDYGIPSSDMRQNPPGWFVRGRRVAAPKPFHPSTNMAHALEVVAAMRSKLFSKRHFFAKELRYQVRVEGHAIAWPEALMFLDPVHICRAALRAMEETQP